MAQRRRLDAELVRRGLFESREQAQRAIAGNGVTVNGSVATKASRMVLPGDALEALGPGPRFVGRGGEKLEGALDDFAIDPSGRRCVDVGSSTGGFTDCLLQGGAASVVAIDVGTAQLHERLRSDERVDVHEQTDVRSIDPKSLGAPFDLVVVDVSFIGLERILDVLVALMAPPGDLVVLVKPQFEAGRSEADRSRGVIRDPAVWRRVLGEVVAAARSRALSPSGVTVSPVKGGAGNVEFFLWLRGPGAPSTEVVGDHELDAVVERAGGVP